MTDSNRAQAFWGSIDLAAAALGGEALLCSDDFFASMDNLLKEGRGVFLPEEYTERGKWMDGWESRRKRVPGHDWCIVRLGVPGRIVGVDIDTNHFLGNHPPFASLDACHAPGASAEELRDSVQWTPLLGQLALQRGSQNLASVASGECWTHVRLNIFPAGGVARLRVFGEPRPAPSEGRVDLASLLQGGRALACSDMFFSPMNNLLLPGRAENMGGGWETRRSRPPGRDWVILRLGSPGDLEEIEIDTAYFRGNYPDRCAVDALYWPDAPPHSLTRSADWTEIVPSTKLRADEQRLLPVRVPGPWTHLRLRIEPDGGVSRLRAWGRPSSRSPAEDSGLLTSLNALEAAEATEAFARCCGARRWVEAMVAQRPFRSESQLFGLAESLWWGLADADWKEAFTHHPRIGADVEALREKFAGTAEWSEGEQAGVHQASDETLRALAQGNTDYEARYGWIFIVCASGRTAEEMLALLTERMDNEPDAELRIAAGEQVKITRLRLQKLEL
ncbi:MAG: allantoicase [Myxococcota bacterium]|nr:allantoicase [Myxococcota bacterium]